MTREERLHKLKNGSDTAKWAFSEIMRLTEDLYRCRTQASYIIGSEEALKNQLNKIRDIATESLNHHKTVTKQE